MARKNVQTLTARSTHSVLKKQQQNGSFFSKRQLVLLDCQLEMTQQNDLIKWITRRWSSLSNCFRLKNGPNWSAKRGWLANPAEGTVVSPSKRKVVKRPNSGKFSLLKTLLRFSLQKENFKIRTVGLQGRKRERAASRCQRKKQYKPEDALFAI